MGSMSRAFRRCLPAAVTLVSSVMRVLLVYAFATSVGMSGAYDVASASTAPVKNPNCTPDVIPTGQSNPPGSESEPMAPIWCYTLVKQGAPTRVTGTNDWVDTFQGVTQMGQF